MKKRMKNVLSAILAVSMAIGTCGFSNVYAEGVSEAANDVDTVSEIEEDETTQGDIVESEGAETSEEQSDSADLENSNTVIEDSTNVYSEDNIESENISNVADISNDIPETQDSLDAMSASASEIIDSGTCGENLEWVLTGDGTLTISGNGEMENYDFYFTNKRAPWLYYESDNILSVVIEEGVTNIGDNAFEQCDNLASIKIPESVTSIGDGVFSYCSSLTSIEIPESVINIGDRAFEDCSNLISIEIPAGVTSIGNGVFADCTVLPSINIPTSVTSIGDRAFAGCTNLSSINIPMSVTSIGGYAFEDCSSLMSIEIPESVTNIGYYAFSGCRSLTSIEIPVGVTNIEDGVFSICSDLTNVEIPESVTSIGSESFSGCSSLASIEIPKSVTSIDRDAFSSCSSLINIEIPESVVSIGNSAFSNCSSLTNIEIPKSVTNIDAYTFAGCSNLISIEIPESVTSISIYAFAGCSSLTNIEIPANVTSIRGYTFSKCSSLTSIEIPEGVTSIGEYAFSECSSLTSIEIPENVTSIGRYAFRECSSLTSIEIPESVTDIGESVFRECSSLTSIEIPKGVTSIGDWTFAYCDSLKSIKIPKSVTMIGDMAFTYCSSLADVYYGGSEKEWNEIEIGSENFGLREATIHFNSSLDDEPLIQDISANENEVYGVCNSSCSLSGTYTPSNPDTIKEELEKIEFKVQDPEIAEVADFSYLSNVDNKEASWYLNLNCKNVGDTVLDINIPNSDIEGLSIPIYVEPELELPDSNIILIDEYDAHLQLNQESDGKIKVTVKLNNADANYLNDFVKNIQCIIEKTPTSSDEYVANISTSHTVSDDGLELTYFITVDFNLNEFDNIITILTPAQKKTIRIIKEKGEENYFVLNRDTNEFPHTAEYFTGGDTTGLIGQGYTTSQYYYEKLIDGLEDTEASELLSFMNGEWGGSCHGMAVSMGLANIGRLNVELLPMMDSESHNYSGLLWPNNSIPLRNIINYFQLLQEVGKDGEPEKKIKNPSIFEKYEGSNWTNASELGTFWDEFCEEVRLADQNETPLLLGFGYDNGNVKSGHTVLTCGYEETDIYNIIKKYDCNSVGNALAKYYYLFIDKDDNSFYLSSTNDVITPLNMYISNDNWNYIKYYNMDIWNIFDTEIENDLSANTLSLYSSGYSDNLFSFTIEAGKAFKITDSAGNYLQCVNGKIGGNLKVYDFDILGDNARYKFILDNNDYTITDFGDKTQFGLKGVDRYYSISSSGANQITVYQDKGIELSGENVSFTADVSIFGEIGLIRLEGENTGNISINNDEKGVNVNTDTANGSVNVSKITEEGVIEKESYTDLNDLQLDNEGEKVEVHDHSYAAPKFIWSEDCQTCTAVFNCEAGDNEQMIECAITSETTDPTCTADGKTVYTATASFADEEYADTQEKIITATGHTYEYTDNGDGTHTKACTAGDDTVTEPHTYQDGICTVCGAEEPEGHIHQYGRPKFTWSDDYSSCTVTFTCLDGDDQQTVVSVVTSKDNEDGTVTYYAVAEFNGESYITQRIVAVQEEPEEKPEGGKPTESENGNTPDNSSNVNDGSAGSKPNEETASAAQTGDDNNPVLWIVSMLSAGGILLLIQKKKYVK